MTGAAVIDAHVHLWDLDAHPQPWTAPFPVLRRSFTSTDLDAVLAQHGVDAAILIVAGDTREETRELLALAACNPRLSSVVGWVDLTADVDAQLAQLRSGPGGQRLCGVRHQLQLEPDPFWLRRGDVRAGLECVADAGLTYDLVVSPHQLRLVIDMVTTLPGLRFVLDHAGKPPIASGELTRWREDLAALARSPNVAVKLSGLVTEADWDNWSIEELQPVIAHALDCFGTERTMAGSDWPVCLLAADYRAVQETLVPALERLDSREQTAVLGGTALAWYQRAAR